MAGTEGAIGRHRDDPVLSNALSEMASEGAFEQDTSDPTPTDASQADSSASAGTPAAPAQATGDNGGSPSNTAPLAAPAAPPNGQQPAAHPQSPQADPGPQGQPTAGAPAADDPLAGTEPYRYQTPDGQAHTIDGIVRVPGEGLLVPEDQVPMVEQLFQQRDALDQLYRESTTQNADYERLSAWRIQGENGQPIDVTGLNGLVAQRLDFAALDASFKTLSDLFKPDPQTGQYTKLFRLLTTDPQGRLTINTEELNGLLERADYAERDARYATRDRLSQVLQARPASTQAAPAGQQAAPDVNAQAAPLIEQALTQASLDKALLTPPDREFLAQQLHRYVRQVTPDDRRWNPALRVGDRIVDASFAQVVQDRANLRAEQKKAAEAAERAGKFNGGQDRGRQPAPRQAAPAPQAPPKPPTPTERQKPDWDSPLKTALAEMDIAR